MFSIEHKSKGLVAHGTSACAGCGLEICLRKTLEVLGEDTITVCPPACVAIFNGPDEFTRIKLAGVQPNLGNSAAAAAGIRAALDAKGNDHTTVLAFAGDGGTLDIGLQALSGAMERRDKILYVCYDNEAYENTGGQASSSTPLYASSTTTPAGKPTPRKDLVQIAIAHDIPYAATASVFNIKDLKMKVKKAKDTEGPSLLHIYSPCPSGWKYAPSKTIEMSKAAADTGCWILYEYEDGKVKINYKPKELKPITEYLKYQKRYSGLSQENIDKLQQHIRSRYERNVALLKAISDLPSLK